MAHTHTHADTHTQNVTDLFAIPRRQSRSNKGCSFIEQDTLNILEETNDETQQTNQQVEIKCENQ